MERATFAAGCFWGVEETFRTLPGVLHTAVGYMGGQLAEPSYQQVCSDTSGHAEVVDLAYDPQQISYAELLTVFWRCHNPTTRNRQGWDLGSQYRSAIFYHSDQQRHQAWQSKAELEASACYADPIVTEIVAATTFWRAEEYHQLYLLKQRGGCCAPEAGA